MTAPAVVVVDEWLRQYAAADPSAPTLVVFPHAGGAAGYFTPLAQALAPAVRVLAVQYPGRLERRAEPPVPDLRELARQAGEAVLRYAPAGPVAYFGHSMGALVAFEAALLGERGDGPSPHGLIVSGGRAPGLTRVEPALLHSDLALVEEVLMLGGSSREVLENEDLRALVLPALRADYRALGGYAADPLARLDCPVSVLVGDRDPLVTPAQARRWQDHAAGRFTFRVLPGDHFYLTPRLPDVVAAVRAVLAPSS
ncbi:alpha/beta fold hydrolase [Kitasatospora sp. NBC_01287]|uniref:thioesterase II family protein n=1 Tax=Kitasatospora sp. NBC_01287 TaxID=2903573 RepID=UPI002250217C|nr:alpha/beta fold hydrolase [Kitasatospora sp. NBC_01287]MCX4751625.1 alpha/beta fold hydrolase [Kitasatospora sp. NBC_01287]